jgi:hypothetical protein
MTLLYKVIDSYGKGIQSIQSCKEGTPILSDSPAGCVIDEYFIHEYCSGCFKLMKKALRCSKCKFIYYVLSLPLMI